MCSWNCVKQAGHLPLPNVGASSDIHVREMLPHTSLHLLPGLSEQNGSAESCGKARATAVSWPRDTSHGVWHTSCQVHTLVRATVQCYLKHVFKHYCSQVFLNKATRTGRSQKRAQKWTCRLCPPCDGGFPWPLVCRKAAPCGGLACLLLLGVSWCNSTICHVEYSEKGPPILATCRGMTDECGGGEHMSPSLSGLV